MSEQPESEPKFPLGRVMAEGHHVVIDIEGDRMEMTAGQAEHLAHGLILAAYDAREAIAADKAAARTSSPPPDP